MMQPMDKNLKLVITNSYMSESRRKHKHEEESGDVKNYPMELLKRKNISYSRISINLKR